MFILFSITKTNAVIASNLLKSEKLIKCLTFFAKFLLIQVCININNFNYINIVKIDIPVLSPIRRHKSLETPIHTCICHQFVLCNGRSTSSGNCYRQQIWLYESYIVSADSGETVCYGNIRFLRFPTISSHDEVLLGDML